MLMRFQIHLLYITVQRSSSLLSADNAEMYYHYLIILDFSLHWRRDLNWEVSHRPIVVARPMQRYE